MLLTYVEEINPGPDIEWEKFCKEQIDEAVAYAKRSWTDEEYEKWADNQLKDDILRDWSDKKKTLFKKLMIEGKKAEPEIWDSTLMFRTICDIETIEKCKELITHGEDIEKTESTLYEKINDFSILDKLVQINENWDVCSSILKDKVL